MNNAEPQQSDRDNVVELVASTTKIRGARLDDVQWIVAQLRDFAKFYGTKRSLFPESQQGARDLVERMIAQHLFIVAESPDGGTPYGFISGFVVPHVFNPDIKVLSEAFWWVRPKYRGGRAGSLLLKAFVDWGRKNAMWITMTLEAHSPVRPDTILKQGFRLSETTYLMEVE